MFVSDYTSGRIRIISNLNDGIATGLKETIMHEHPLIYPNPCDNYLQVKSIYKINKIEVYDTFGGLILISIEKNLDISALKNGVYLLKVYSEAHPARIKFIKNTGT